MKETSWAELDLRSLAMFRIILGFFVLLDTLLRLPDLRDFMTDDGVLPRLQLVSSPIADYWISLHLGSGDLLGQWLLSLALGLLAVGLMVGWRTPWMVGGCWLMLNSLLARNPFIADRGDLQLTLLLFWAMFLPLGACWSKDARAGRVPLGKARGLPAAALILQFAFIYLFAAFLKTGDFWLARGDGLKFSLLSPVFATKLAHGFSQVAQPVLQPLNYLVIAGELFVGLLLLTPIFVALLRPVVVLTLFGFHLAVAALFTLGLFPWIGALTPVVLLPKEFWNGVLKSEQPAASPSSSRWSPLFDLVVALGMLLALWSNLSFQFDAKAWQRPAWLQGLTEILRLEQHWDLFAPEPPINGAFQLSAIAPEGREIVLFQGPPGPEHPAFQPFPDHRWRMLMLATLYPKFSYLRERTARVLARRYPEVLPPGSRLQYSFLLRPISKKGEFEPPVKQLLWREP